MPNPTHAVSLLATGLVYAVWRRSTGAALSKATSRKVRSQRSTAGCQPNLYSQPRKPFRPLFPRFRLAIWPYLAALSDYRIRNRASSARMALKLPLSHRLGDGSLQVVRHRLTEVGLVTPIAWRLELEPDGSFPTAFGHGAFKKPRASFRARNDTMISLGSPRRKSRAEPQRAAKSWAFYGLSPNPSACPNSKLRRECAPKSLFRSSDDFNPSTHRPCA